MSELTDRMRRRMKNGPHVYSEFEGDLLRLLEIVERQEETIQAAEQDEERPQHGPRVRELMAYMRGARDQLERGLGAGRELWKEL